MAIEDKSFIQINVDNKIIEEQVKEEIRKKLSDIETEKLFYTLDDLVAITGMSKGFIEKQFFHDPRFKKIRRKAGRKWLMPVNETRDFLLTWIKELPHS